MNQDNLDITFEQLKLFREIDNNNYVPAVKMMQYLAVLMNTHIDFITSMPVSKVEESFKQMLTEYTYKPDLKFEFEINDEKFKLLENLDDAGLYLFNEILSASKKSEDEFTIDDLHKLFILCTFDRFTAKHSDSFKNELERRTKLFWSVRASIFKPYFEYFELKKKVYSVSTQVYLANQKVNEANIAGIIQTFTQDTILSLQQSKSQRTLKSLMSYYTNRCILYFYTFCLKLMYKTSKPRLLMIYSEILNKALKLQTKLLK